MLGHADVLGVVALGGGLGSLGRYGAQQVLPTAGPGFPWSTLVVNLAGSALIGVLMVFVTDVWRPGRYARPFLGIGVLGGLTTYSTMTLDLRTLATARDWLLAGGYLVATVVGGLLAVWVGLAATRLATGTARRHEEDSR
jgi:fluoride exporter